MICSLSSDASTTRAPPPPKSWGGVDPPIPVSFEFGGSFGTQILVGPSGLDPGRTQTYLLFTLCLAKQNFSKWPLRPQCVQM